MANPQPDKFLKVSLELMDAICKIRIPGEAGQVFHAIIRKTYGYKKSEDWISLSQFEELTGLSKTHICQAINKLMAMNIITQKGNSITEKGKGYGATYSIQKDYEKWQPLPKKVTLPKKVKVITEKGKKALPKKGTTIDNDTIDNITKDNINNYMLAVIKIPLSKYEQFKSEYPDLDIDDLLMRCDEYWSERMEIVNQKKPKFTPVARFRTWLDNARKFKKEDAGHAKTENGADPLAKYKQFD